LNLFTKRCCVEREPCPIAQWRMLAVGSIPEALNFRKRALTSSLLRGADLLGVMDVM